jgi:SanA protein
MKKLLKMIFTISLYCLLAAVVIFGLPKLIAIIYARPHTYAADQVPTSRAAIVFGAGLQRDGTPTTVLRDRVATAADLYFSGKVQKLLLSGDNRFLDYNEPGAMREYALGLGIPEKDIVLDYAGRRTYDTCYRAIYIFGLKDAILVTQNFHLPRALILCNEMGMSANGVSSDRHQYSFSASQYWELRELPATLVALWEVWISHPLPILGEQELIFPPDSTQTKSN